MSAPARSLALFAHTLREAGLSVSTAELLDAAASLLAVDPLDRVATQAGLEATLVRDRADLPLFRSLFHLTFLGLGAKSVQKNPALQGETDLESTSREAELRLAAILGGGGFSPWAEGLVPGREDLLFFLAREVVATEGLDGLRSPLQRGLFAVRLWDAAMASGLASDLLSLEEAFDDLPEEERAALGVALARRLAALRAHFGEEIDGRLQASRLLTKGGGEAGPDARPLSGLSPEEIAQMTHLVRRLAEFVRDRMRRQQRVRRRGRFDVQRTLRASLRYGGIPARPIFRQRHRQKPRLLLLTDVSDSVQNVARFFLHFVATLQQTVIDVRCFLFVSEMGEATELFRDATVHEAVDRAFAGQVVNLNAHSNYGRAFAAFARKHLSSVHPRSTVLVIGDGRNNHNPARAEALQQIRRRVRRLIWLCPEPRLAWGFGDSEMPRYARHCDRVEVVRTFADLRRLVESVPAW